MGEITQCEKEIENASLKQLIALALFGVTSQRNSTDPQFRTNLRLLLVFSQTLYLRPFLNLSLDTLRIISLAAEHLKINLRKP